VACTSKKKSVWIKEKGRTIAITPLSTGGCDWSPGKEKRGILLRDQQRRRKIFINP